MKKKFLVVRYCIVAISFFCFKGAIGWANDTLTVSYEPLEEIVVSVPRVQQTTTNHQVLQNEQINQQNTGQNLPYLLSSVPSLQVTSDDGLGVGYTYFRLRGTDHTRINMTINNVPLNDSESQTVFWVNMADIATFLTSIDVQRGVGTSTNGVAAFGGSINMETHEQPTDKNEVVLCFNGGMYNTFREQISGVFSLSEAWKLKANFSKVNSDGFVYRTNSDLYSYYADLGYYTKKTQVVWRFFGGKEKTGMGWDGVSYDVAYGKNGADRRYNSAGEYVFEGKTHYYPNSDNYAQQHAQMHVLHRINPQWNIDFTAHYTHGGGYYEQLKNKPVTYFGLPTYTNEAGEEVTATDAIYRQALNNHFAGFVFSTQYISDKLQIQAGAAANDYLGWHYGTILSVRDVAYPMPLQPHQEYYRSRSNKADANMYVKMKGLLIHRNQEQLSWYADVQYRYIFYKMWGINSITLQDLPISKHYHFFNPKVGLSYQNHNHLVYGSFAVANREPSRTNFTENVLWNESQKTYSGKMPTHEQLFDYEVGYNYSHSRFHFGTNLYAMDYRNQLVLTGKIGDTGNQLTTNVKKSYRIGVELTAGVHITDWLQWEANCVLSCNKIKNHTETITLYDHSYNFLGTQDLFFKRATIAFSPTITGMSNLNFHFKHFDGSVQTHFVSKQYLDNTQNESAILHPYTTTNLNLQYQIPLKTHQPNLTLRCQINNVFNAYYASNGGNDGSCFDDGKACWPWFYAQSGINVHAGFIIKW